MILQKTKPQDLNLETWNWDWTSKKKSLPSSCEYNLIFLFSFQLLQQSEEAAAEIWKKQSQEMDKPKNSANKIQWTIYFVLAN